jgi:hypothetical protein
VRDNGLIPGSAVLTDRYGVDWSRAENYQDFDTSAPGWLALKRHDASGTVRSFPDVIRECGFAGQWPAGRDDRFLMVRFKEESRA